MYFFVAGEVLKKNLQKGSKVTSSCLKDQGYFINFQNNEEIRVYEISYFERTLLQRDKDIHLICMCMAPLM